MLYTLLYSSKDEINSGIQPLIGTPISMLDSQRVREIQKYNDYKHGIEQEASLYK